MFASGRGLDTLALASGNIPVLLSPSGLLFFSIDFGTALMTEREELASDVTDIMYALFKVMKKLPDTQLQSRPPHHRERWGEMRFITSAHQFFA